MGGRMRRQRVLHKNQATSAARAKPRPRRRPARGIGIFSRGMRQGNGSRRRHTVIMAGRQGFMERAAGRREAQAEGFGGFFQAEVRARWRKTS